MFAVFRRRGPDGFGASSRAAPIVCVDRCFSFCNPPSLLPRYHYTHNILYNVPQLPLSPSPTRFTRLPAECMAPPGRHTRASLAGTSLLRPETNLSQQSPSFSSMKSLRNSASTTVDGSPTACRRSMRCALRFGTARSWTPTSLR